jgi:LPXTG-site transpeptidase (sortase) family protein
MGSQPPVNLLRQFRKTFILFSLFFVFFFVVLELWQFFDFARRQVEALAQTKIDFVGPSVSSRPLSSPFFSALPSPNPAVFANTLEIAKLNVKAPLVFAQTEQMKELMRDLEKGVVVYPGSSLPGQEGSLVVLGHSAPSFWPKIKYEWVFSRLNELVFGDEVEIGFAGQEYRYQVVRKIFLERGQDLPVGNEGDSLSFLYLVTCWPPGRDLRRLVVEAVLTTE